VKISLVIPVLNEAEALPLLFRALFPVLDSIDCEYEVLFVNDGSTDDTLDILSRAAGADPRIKVLSFSRNFGHQAAITAGIDFSTGDAVIVMDADLQDPPELLPEMVRLYREGYDVVSPQRVSRQSDTWFKRKTAALFYLLMRTLVDQRIPAEVSDFRLLSRNAVIALRQFREQHRFLRGMIAWLGLREAMLPFERQPRAAGETKYGLSKMLRFSWTAICSFSALPLRMTMWLGLATSALGMGYLCWAVYMDLVRKRVVWGWTSLVFLQCLFFGVTLVCVSLIGDYIARIYEESKQRPLYVVNRAVNIVEAPEDAGRTVFLAPRRVESGIHANRV
jgi:glycosyltransferase involved in cell wall biosynthesis